jgi:hypothetical protein
MTRLVDSLRQQADHILERVAEIEKFPKDEFPNGTVVKFRKQFNSGPKTRYSYAAIKVKGRWYTSGPRSGGPYSWDELCEWMGAGVTQIKVATGWRNLL